MGAYLSEPVLEKVSEKGEKNGLCFGASAVQGWRVGMEDAHSCLTDFDDGTFMFGVYDGHGGSEVAEYTAKKLADVIKSTESYKQGNLRQCLIDAFLQIDKNFITEEVMEELRVLAGLNKEECEGDEDEAALLAQEASMPLAELLAKMKQAVKGTQEQEDKDEEEEDVKEKETETKETNGVQNNSLKEDELNKIVSDEKEEKELKKDEGETEKKNADKNKEKSKDETQKETKVVEEEKGETADDGNDDGFEEEEEEDSDSEEEEEDGSDDEEEEDDEEDELQNGLLGAKSDEVAYDSGTTAIVALLKDNHLVVSNVGDSRCVLSRSGIAIDMSIDHKPEDEKEYTRIVEAGGKVTRDGRVNGGLNLSRALGDHSYKLKDDFPPEKQQISAMPDIKETTLTESDEFMVLACDGIWNVKNSQDVVDFVSQKIRKQRESEELDLQQICEDLFDECMAPDTSGDGTGCDNMTCVIVLFDKNRPFVSIGKSKRKTSECSDNDKADKKQKLEDEK